MRPTVRLGRIAGIEIGVHITWLGAFFVITWSLAGALYPATFPEWNPVTYWAAGAVTTLLLFASVLVHELAHPFVALGRGLPVDSITLFIFGGVSNLRADARKASDELLIAAAGPATSMVLAVLFWSVSTLDAEGLGLTAERNPVWAAVALRLAVINALVAAFNMLPGFPLDGGRVLRSGVWAATGSLVKATNVATALGQLCGWALMALGVYYIVWLDSIFGGVWIAATGWLISAAAAGARQEMAALQMFRQVRASDMVRAGRRWPTPWLPLDHAISRWLITEGARVAPVEDGGAPAGLLTMDAVKEVPPRVRPFRCVADVLTAEPMPIASPEDDLAGIVDDMDRTNVPYVIVAEEGHLLDIIDRSRAVTYLKQARELGLVVEGGEEATSRLGTGPQAERNRV
ncbi:MAG: hypothetical protein FJ319_03940 [SAR202 cluster bacterium]|nr:hypothetical protein [SAR202 cluster bacterium]